MKKRAITPKWVMGFNKSKTVNKNRNLTWSKNDQHSKISLPCNFEVNLITHLGVIALLSLVSIGLVLSEEKIFEKVYDVRRTPSDGNSSHDPLGQVS
jgi:hypothetical protein